MSSGEISPEQRAALEDGHVTREEYLAAVEIVRACLRDRGFDVSQLEVDPFDETVGYTISVGDTPPEVAEPIIDACEHEHGAAVQAAYADQLDEEP